MQRRGLFDGTAGQEAYYRWWPTVSVLSAISVVGVVSFLPEARKITLEDPAMREQLTLLSLLVVSLLLSGSAIPSFAASLVVAHWLYPLLAPAGLPGLSVVVLFPVASLALFAWGPRQAKISLDVATMVAFWWSIPWLFARLGV